MHKFTHIGSFLQVIRYIEAMKNNPECPPEKRINSSVRYEGTVKLHGTNCSVLVTRNELVAQSRTRVITPEDDNYGFAAFVAEDEHTKNIREIETSIRRDMQLSSTTDIVLYGEWIGPGIQKGVVINKIRHKSWVLFAIKAVPKDGESYYLDPGLLSFDLDSNYYGIFSIRALPRLVLVVDFSNDKSKELALSIIETETKGVEAECPWGRFFGYLGTGEGIVWTPVGVHEGNTKLYFKSKGTKHEETESNRETPSLAPEVIESVDRFVDFAVTENRLAQGIEVLKEQGHAVEMKAMGQYLKWIGQNIKRESVVELESNSLDWAQVSKAVTTKARAYFQKHVNGLVE